MCLVWSQLANIRTPPIVNSDFIYVRLIGDRSIQEKDFGRIQIDRIKEMKKVTRDFKDDTDRGNMSGVNFQSLPQTIITLALVLAPSTYSDN